MLSAAAGHLWTVLPAAMDGLLGTRAAFGRPFSTVVEDQTMGAVRLTGILDEPDGAFRLEVFDVVDPVQGTIRLKRSVSAVDAMTLESRSQVTKRVGKASDAAPN